MTQPQDHKKPERLRLTIANGFTRVEDGVYIGLGVLLALSAAALLVNVAIGFGASSPARRPPASWTSSTGCCSS